MDHLAKVSIEGKGDLAMTPLDVFRMLRPFEISHALPTQICDHFSETPDEMQPQNHNFKIIQYLQLIINIITIIAIKLKLNELWF